MAWRAARKKKQLKKDSGRDTGHALLHLLITLAVWLSVPAIEVETASVVRFWGDGLAQIKALICILDTTGATQVKCLKSFWPPR